MNVAAYYSTAVKNPIAVNKVNYLLLSWPFKTFYIYIK